MGAAEQLPASARRGRRACVPTTVSCFVLDTRISHLDHRVSELVTIESVSEEPRDRASTIALEFQQIDAVVGRRRAHRHLSEQYDTRPQRPQLVSGERAHTAQQFNPASKLASAPSRRAAQA